MSRTQRPYMRFIGFAIVLLVANSTLTKNAIGQTASVQLPANCSAYASVPLPEEANHVPSPKAAPACASYRFYRGIGRAVNYADARACAWRERLAQEANLGQNQQEPTAWVVGGSLILADIYFNGAGVKRNIPLAMRFACEWDEQSAMLARRYMTEADISGRSSKRFEFCDYGATTFTMDFCSEYASETEDARRSRYYSWLKTSMSHDQQTAFEKLLAAENAYIDAHAAEVDQGGTIRSIRTIGSQDILQNLFHTELVHFERRRWPSLSENQIATADALLHRAYEKKLGELRAQTQEQIKEGAVSAGHLSSAERAWETYRDAWVAFARLRYPAAVAAIRAEITLGRYRLVRTIYAY